LPDLRIAHAHTYGYAYTDAYSYAIAYAYTNTNTYAYSQTYAYPHSYPDADADSGGVLSQFHDSGRVRCASVSHYRRWKHRTRLERALCEYHRQL
jgi:hypothetical protein